MHSEKHILKKKRKRRLENILSIFILLSLLLGGLTGYYSSKIMRFLDDISVDTSDSDPDSLEYTKRLDELEPFSALILGLDVEEEDNSRSDTIIVVTVNPKSEDIKMVSIPRDTLITLTDEYGYEYTEKINAAHATGGPRAARDIIGEYLDIPIQFYATMDFDGLIELVDAVGGVTVDSDLAFSQSDYRNPGRTVNIVEGEQHLTGDDALAYARMRKTDPRGDFGRQDRQQQVVVGILEKLVSFNTIANLNNILNAISPHLSTNATSNQMLTIATNYTGAVKNIEQLSIEGYADTTFFPHYGHEVYSWHADGASLFEVQNALKAHLGLEVSEEEYYLEEEEYYEEEYPENEGYEEEYLEDGYYEDGSPEEEYYEEETEEYYEPELGY